MNNTDDHNNNKVEKTEEEWKKILTPEQYEVMRGKGTEARFSGKYVHEDKEGTYKCIACASPLFMSDTKFDSGTGWPSFDKAIPGAIRYIEDKTHGFTRTEVVCATCGSHLGHVFDDGPTVTGTRYCLNSVCLDLEEKKQEEKK